MTTPLYAFNAHYLKDLSFESPLAPASLFAPKPEKPAIDLNVDLRAQRLNETSYELVMMVSAKASTSDNQVIFVVETQYAGVFSLPPEQLENAQEILLSEAPYALFPFVRRVVADITRDGGFPPLMLDGVDFRSLYQARAKEGKNGKARAKANG